MEGITQASRDGVLGGIRELQEYVEGIPVLGDPVEPPPPPPPDELIPPGKVRVATKFADARWKPVSESDGKLVFLFPPIIDLDRMEFTEVRRDPHPDTVIERLRSFGYWVSSAGTRHAVFRGSQPGAAYGDDIVVASRGTDQNELWYDIAVGALDYGWGSGPDLVCELWEPDGSAPPPPPVGEVVLRENNGIWMEGGYYNIGSAEPVSGHYFHKANQLSARGLNIWVPRWAHQPVHSINEIRRQLSEVSQRGFTHVCIDDEAHFWYTSGYCERWVREILRQGLVPGVAPKATMGELSGRPNVNVGAIHAGKLIDYYKRIGIQFYAPWAYGSATTNIGAHNILVDKGVHPQNILVIHDHFRNSGGYRGLTEWPKLAHWEAAPDRKVCNFQPQGDPDRGRARRILGEMFA